MKDQSGNVTTNNYATNERFQRALPEQMARLYPDSLLKDYPCDRFSANHFGLTAVCDRVVYRYPGDLFIHHGSSCGSPFESKVTSNPSIRKPTTGTREAISTEYLFSRPVPVIRLRRQDEPLATSPAQAWQCHASGELRTRSDKGIRE